MSVMMDTFCKLTDGFLSLPSTWAITNWSGVQRSRVDAVNWDDLIGLSGIAQSDKFMADESGCC